MIVLLIILSLEKRERLSRRCLRYTREIFVCELNHSSEIWEFGSSNCVDARDWLMYDNLRVTDKIVLLEKPFYISPDILSAFCESFENYLSDAEGPMTLSNSIGAAEKKMAILKMIIKMKLKL